MLDMFKKFMSDKDAYEMFITGPAGTGKTTSLNKLVLYLQAEKVPHVICAFTHQACGVLASKLPTNANISTLHSFLKKRPGINDKALRPEHVEVTTKFADSEEVSLILLDEFSMAGEKDYMDLVDLQANEDGELHCKIVYIGDPYQLPPVKDQQTIVPNGKYVLKLTTVYRADNDDLQALLGQLVMYLDGSEQPKTLTANKHFQRGQDIVERYQQSMSDSKTMLAWTNKRVQELNFAVQEATEPSPGDILWNATLRQELVFNQVEDIESVKNIKTFAGPLHLHSKYKTLEFLLDQPYLAFYNVDIPATRETCVLAVCFGTNNYKFLAKKLTENAVADNQKIVATHNVKNAAEWCRANPRAKLARVRANAWRRLLSFKKAVCQVDFPHCTTIHKAQGSTYDEVYLDAEDLARCGSMNLDMYLRLYYVAVSRARTLVVTN